MSPLKFSFFRKKKDLAPPHSIPHRQDFYSFQQHHSIAPAQLIMPLHCQCQLCSQPSQPMPIPQYPYHHQQPLFQPIQPQFVPLATATNGAAAAAATTTTTTTAPNQIQQPYQCACLRCPHQHQQSSGAGMSQPNPQLLQPIQPASQSYLRATEHVQFPQLCQNLTSQPELQSRYANVESIRHPSHSFTSEQEPLYCNQKALESTLPPYQAPPDYATFMAAQKKLATLHGRHTSHHSESILMQRVTDSSYANVRNSLYGNVHLCKHQYTS